MCCGKIYDCLRFISILDPRVLCGQSLCAFMSISVLAHVVFSQWSFGPCGQASSRGQPNDGRNESFPCVHVWSGLWIACLYPCWHCFDGSMKYLATRDQQRYGFLMCLFCQLLSDVWHRAVVKTKSVLIGFSLNRLNRLKYNHLNSLFFKMYIYILFSFYILLFLVISFYILVKLFF